MLISLLRSAYTTLIDAPKCEVDDMAGQFCDYLGRLGREQAMEFVDHPLRRTEHGDAEAQFYRSLAEDLHVLLRVYRSRATWLSVQEKSEDRLRSGLLAFALSYTDDSDWRDLLVALAPYHHCAQELKIDPSALFRDASAYAPEPLREHYIAFGKRTDVSLGSFGWREVDTPGGVRFREGATWVVQPE